MQLSAVLFDLDGTLLDTSELRVYRDFGQWDYVMSNLAQAKEFASKPHLLPQQLRAKGLKVGVVTASRRMYAEALLAQFGIVPDVLVTGSDGLDAKPSSATIERALHQLGVAPSAAVYVGDEAKDFEASYRAGVLSVGAGWAHPAARFSRLAPDIVLGAPHRLLELKDELRFAAEVTAPTVVIHEGTFVEFEEGRALGRYFQTADMRHATHSLSRDLITLKNSDEPAERLAMRLAQGLWIIEQTWIPSHVATESCDRGRVCREVHLAGWLEGASRRRRSHDRSDYRRRAQSTPGCRRL